MATARHAKQATTSPTAYASAAEQIHDRFDQFTPAERKVARVLLTHYPVAGLDPLPELARRAAVSHPTVLRLVSKLGYSGFPQFQAALREELTARFMSPLGKTRNNDTPARDGDHFFARFADTVCENVRQSAAILPDSEFEAAAGLMADPDRAVYLLGGRFTDAIATYLYMHLRVLRPAVSHVTGAPVSWSEYLLDIDQRAVVVVFDIRRYQDDVVHFGQEAAARGARVILVTDQWLSPIAGQATHVLPVRIEVPSSWDSASAILVLVEALIARINNQRWEIAAERIQALETLRRRLAGPTDDTSLHTDAGERHDR